MRIAARAPEPFAALLATGLTAWLVFQALINMAVVTTLLPFTGLTLPFLSYGSSSLVMCMVAAGILLNISRHTSNRPAPEPQASLRAPRRARWSPGDALRAWWRDWRRAPRAGRRRGPAGTAGRSARRIR
jgi:cell division protein FtsW